MHKIWNTCLNALVQALKDDLRLCWLRLLLRFWKSCIPEHVFPACLLYYRWRVTRKIILLLKSILQTRIFDLRLIGTLYFKKHYSAFVSIRGIETPQHLLHSIQSSSVRSPHNMVQWYQGCSFTAEGQHLNQVCRDTGYVHAGLFKCGETYMRTMFREDLLPQKRMDG